MKNKYSLLAILLSLTLSSTGCASLGNSDKTRVLGYSTTEEETIDKLNNMCFEYDYEDYYLSDEEISSIINRKSVECVYKYDGNIDTIIESIKENSNKYLKEHNEYEDFFSSDENIEVLKNVLEKINREQEISEDMHKISTIRVVYENDLESKFIAYYDEELNVLFVNKSLLDTVKTNQKDLLLPYVLEHEMYHVRQIACPCNTLGYDSIEYTEYPTFILESSAESHIMLYDDEFNLEDYAYEEERRDESLLLLLGLFKNDSIDGYYKSITNQSIQELLDYYDIKENETNAIFKILYSMDGRFCRNNLPYDINGSKNVTYKELYDSIGFSYKTNLYKMLINRMIVYTSSNDISLEENLIVYDIIRAMILENTYDMYIDQDGEIQKTFNKDVVNDVYDLDSIYIEYLSKVYNVSIEEIRELETTTTKYGVYNISKSMTDNIELSEAEKGVLNRFPTLDSVLRIHGSVFAYLYEESLEDIGKEVYNK